MKKLGLLGVVALMSASGAAHAVDTSMIKFEGNARLKYQSDNRVDYQNNRRYTLLRVRPGMTVTPNSKTSLVIVPQFAKALGEPTHISSSTTANTEVSTSGSSSLGAHGEFGVYEAYVGWQPLGWSEFYFGRQSLKYGDGLVIGQGNWGNHGRSFDALRARAKYGLGWSDLLFSKIKEYNTSDSSTIERGDKDLWALYSSWDLGQYFKNVDPYVFYQRDRSSFNSAVKSDRYIADHLWTVGARLRSDVEKFDYRLEVNKQYTYYTGKDGVQLNGDQQNVELGYNFDCECKPRVAVEWFRASRNYRELYPTTNEFLGRADLFGRRNIMGFGIKTSGSAGDDWSWGFDYYNFSRERSSHTAYRTNGTTSLGGAQLGVSRFLGHEFDLGLKYQANKNLDFKAGYNHFVSSKNSTLRKLNGYTHAGMAFLAMEMKY